MSFNYKDLVVIRIDEDGNTVQERLTSDLIPFENGITVSGGNLNINIVEGSFTVKSNGVDRLVVPSGTETIELKGNVALTSGSLSIEGTPSTGPEVANVQYVDTSIAAFSGVLQSDLNEKISLSALTTTSGVLQNSIDTKASAAYVDTQAANAVSSGNTALLATSGVLNSLVVSTSGSLQADINSRALSYTLTSTSGVLRSYTDTQSAAAVTSGSTALTSASGVLRNYTDVQAAAAVTSGNSALTSASGILQAAINLRANTTYVDTQDSTISGALNTRITSVSGNLQTDINTRALSSTVTSISGSLQTAINSRALTTYVNTQDAAAVTSGSTALTSASGVLNSRITSVSGNLQTDINTRALAATLTTASGTLQTDINNRVLSSTLTSVSGNLQSQIDARREFISYVFGSNANGYSSSSTNITAYGRFVFAGTESLGNLLNLYMNASTSNSTTDGELILARLDTNQVIATINIDRAYTTASVVVFSGSNFVSVPTSPTIIEIRLRRTAGNGNVRLYSLVLELSNL